jgi:HAD superfamily hydrolase (TIGR01458 family)
MRFDGVLLDLDGTLVVSWEPIPGATGAIGDLRSASVPFKILTNTTTHSRRGLSRQLGAAGFDIGEDEIVTAASATAEHLRRRHPGEKIFLIAEGEALEDMDGIETADRGCSVVVIGDAEDMLTYGNMNRAFGMLLDGAALVAMHRGMYWRTSAGLQLDIGAYVAGLEEAAGVRATVCGKPSRGFFIDAADSLGVAPERVLMAGDDPVSDAAAARDAGMSGVLVRTGKYRRGDESKVDPPVPVVDSVAEVVAMVLEEG